MTRVHKIAAIAGILALSVLLACERSKTPDQIEITNASRSIWYADPARQNLLAAELKKAGISYDVVVERGREYIRVTEEDSVRVSAIEEMLFGPELPSGRNIGFDPERQAKFKAWLREDRIPFKEITKDGSEYIVWEESDTEKVRRWHHFPLHYDNPPEPRDQPQ